MRKVTAIIAAFAVGAVAVAAAEAPLPEGVLKAKQEGTIPTAVWLAECESLFSAFLAARRELDELVEMGGYADDAAALSNAINNRTVPAAKAVVDFSCAYVPDTKWGRDLRLELIDAMVSSLAADAHIVEVIEGETEFHVPAAEMLEEQKQVRQDLVEEVHDRLLDAPAKYRVSPEKLARSRAYYFQNLDVKARPDK